MRRQLTRLFGILAAGACIFGLVLVAPNSSPMPTANADVLPNGYDVSCVKVNDETVCNISGCPRVFEDLAGDVVHARVNGGYQYELQKGCDSTTSFRNATAIPPGRAFTLAVQGCRKQSTSKDLCGGWSDYRYTPPAPVAVPVQCPVGSPVASVPAGQLCPAAPVNVKCPEGSPTVDAVSLDKCASVPPKACPQGSVTDTVPAGQQCQGPKNAVALNITQEGVNANIAVTNSSALPAECAYDAKRTQGIIGPSSVNRNIGVGPNSTGNITDLLFPPFLVSYSATVKCTATYDGRQITIGEATQTVSG